MTWLVYMHYITVGLCVGAYSLYNVLQEEACITQHLKESKQETLSRVHNINNSESGLCLPAKHIFSPPL